MSIDVRPSEDADKYLATDQLVWFGEVTDADADHLRLGLPEDQRFVVDLPDGPEDLHTGIYGVRPMEMSLPGGAVVPIAGLTWVGVHPDSRRRGVLAAMMTDHLDPHPRRRHGDLGAARQRGRDLRPLRLRHGGARAAGSTRPRARRSPRPTSRTRSPASPPSS